MAEKKSKLTVTKECIYCPHRFQCEVNDGEYSRYGICPVCERKIKENPEARRELEFLAAFQDPRRV